MRAPLAAVLCLCLVSASLPAVAKPPAKDGAGVANDVKARELYKQGDRAYAEGRYQAALESFEEAHRLSGRPLLLFNIGNALERLGRFEESADTLQKYVSYAERAEVEVLEKRIANLRRRAEEEKQREEEAKREEEATRAASGEGEVEPTNERPKPDREPTQDSVEESDSNTVGWVLLGGGAVALAAGATFGFMALGARGDADGGCKEANGQKLCEASAKDALDRDARYSLMADIGLGIGLVAIGAGAYVLLSGPSRSEQTRAGVSTAFAAGARPGGGEVRLVGSF